MQLVDRVAAAALGLAMLEIVIVAYVRAGRTPLGGPLVTLTVALGLCLLLLGLLLALRGRFGNAGRVASRLLVLLATVAAVKKFAGRWPPSVRPRLIQEASIADSALQRLTVEQRLRWAVRVAAHAVSVSGRVDSALNVPRTWPFPLHTEISVVELSDSVVVSTHERTGISCSLTLYRHAPPMPREGRHDPVRCGRKMRDEGRVAVRRTEWSVPAESVPSSGSESAWMQYRRDASRDASASPGVPGSTQWRTVLDGELRSTASIVGNRVLVGTHGPGAIHVFDAASGRTVWLRYVPNWIHQDVVSDGQAVVMGFGNNTGSLYGDSPGGVSAFSLQSGALLWSAFEGSSVMTSPVLWGGRVAYVTSTGTLVVRNLATGAESGRLSLPGRPPMAPPALIGNTLIAALDDDYVCAIRVETLARLWCTQLPGAGMLGHASPTVLDHRVFVSGGVFKKGTRLGMSLWTVRRIRSMLGWIGPNATDFEYDGQRVWALDLATGRVEWQSKLYPSEYGPGGHISGTVISESDVAVVLLPLAGVMVSFDPQTGRELWTQDVGPSRGPLAHSSGRLFLTLRSGELRVVQARTGAIDCSIPTSAAFDRAGPALADSTLFFGSAKGVFVVVPLGMLTSCKADELRALVQ